jgi:hypothetical protein
MNNIHTIVLLTSFQNENQASIRKNTILVCIVGRYWRYIPLIVALNHDQLVLLYSFLDRVGFRV